MGISTGAAVLGSAVLGAASSRKASNTQADAATSTANLQQQSAAEQLALQRRMYEEGVARQQPWLDAGQNALTKLTKLSDYTPFGMAQFTADPGYSFRMSEGMKALERSAAARGGLLSGATLKGIQRYGQESASQEYNNAFNRYQAERTARLAPLQALAGIGQTSAQQVNQYGQQYADLSGRTAGHAAGSTGEAWMGGANARASGYMGGANALTGALGQYMQYNQNQNYLDLLRKQNVPVPGGSGWGMDLGGG